MKCIIQIPCFNEAHSLPVALQALPRSLPGVDRVEWLVVDDGSIDETAAVAKAHGVDYVVRLPRNFGLAWAFTAGIDACLRHGADVIVNTDADNQYCAEDIATLVRPILAANADIVVGARPISQTQHFSTAKKLLQKAGSALVRILSSTDVTDAASGFRAFSRPAAMRLHIFTGYTYTLESLIQAGWLGLVVVSVPVRTNADLRPSRLVRGTASYVLVSAITLLRLYILYRSFRFFAFLGVLSFAVGLLIDLRFLVYYIMGEGAGHVQSLILAAILVVVGGLLCVVAVLSDLLGVNRQLLMEIDFRLKALDDKIERRPDTPGLG